MSQSLYFFIAAACLPLVAGYPELFAALESTNCKAVPGTGRRYGSHGSPRWDRAGITFTITQNGSSAPINRLQAGSSYNVTVSTATPRHALVYASWGTLTFIDKPKPGPRKCPNRLTFGPSEGYTSSTSFQFNIAVPRNAPVVDITAVTARSELAPFQVGRLTIAVDPPAEQNTTTGNSSSSGGGGGGGGSSGSGSNSSTSIGNSTAAGMNSSSSSSSGGSSGSPAASSLPSSAASGNSSAVPASGAVKGVTPSPSPKPSTYTKSAASPSPQPAASPSPRPQPPPSPRPQPPPSPRYQPSPSPRPQPPPSPRPPSPPEAVQVPASSPSPVTAATAGVRQSPTPAAAATSSTPAAAAAAHG